MAEQLEAEIRLGYREFSAAIDQVIKQTSKLGADVENSLNLVEQRAKAAFAEFSKATQVASADYRQFSKNVSEATKSITLGDLEQRFNSIASAGASAFNSVIDSGADFEQALLKSNTILKVNDEELKAVGESVRKLGGDIGVAIGPTETLAAQYQVLSSGFNKAADADKVLRASLTLSAAGSVDAATATKALTGVLTSYGETAEQAGLRSDQFLKIADLGRAEIPELAQSLGLVTSVTAAAGISFEELGGAIATATENGQTTNAALEGIRGIVTSLISPTAGASKEFAKLGIVVNETTLKQKGLAQTLAEIREANGGQVESLNRIIEGQVGLTSALALTRGGIDKFIGKTAELNDALGTGAKNLAIVNKGANESAKAFSAAVERLKVSASSAVLPLKTGLIKGLTGVIDTLDAVPGPLKTAALALTGLGTALFFAAGAVTAMAIALPALQAQLLAVGLRALPLATAALGVLTTQLSAAAVAEGAFFLGMNAIATAGLGLSAALAGVSAAGAVVVGFLGTALGAIGAVAAVLGVGIIAWNEYTKSVTAATEAEAEIKGQDFRARGVKFTSVGTDRLLNTSAAQLAKEGVTTQAVGEKADFQRRQADELKDTDPERAKAALERSQKLRELRTELAKEIEKLEAAGQTAPDRPAVVDERAEKKADREAEKARDERFKDENQAIELSKAGHEAKIKELKELLKEYQDDGDKRRQIEREIAKETDAIAKESADAKKKAAAEAVKQDIQNAEATGSDAQRLKNLEALAIKYKDNGDVRRTIEDKVRAVEEKIQKEREADIKRTLDLRKAAADEEIRDAESKQTELAKKAERGVDVTAEQETQIRKKAGAEKDKVDVEVEEKVSETKDPKIQRDARAEGAREKARIERDSQTEITDLQEQAAKDQLARQQNLLASDLDIAGKRIALLQELAAAGVSTEAEVKRAIEERLALQIKEIDLQEKLVRSQTDDQEQIKRAEKSAAVARAEAQRQAKTDIEATTEALKKQKAQSGSGATNLNLGGKAFSIEDFIKGQEGFLDITKPKGSSKSAKGAKSVLDALGRPVPDVKKLTGQGPAGPGEQSGGPEEQNIAVAITLLDPAGNVIPSEVKGVTVNGRNSDLHKQARGMA